MVISQSQHAGLLLRYLRPHWLKVLVLALLLFGSIGLQLATPQVLRHFIDQALDGSAVEALATTAVIFLAMALANELAVASAAYAGEDVAWSATNRLRADLALHCLRLDLPFHGKRTPGEMIERIDGDVTTLSGFFSQFTIQIVGNALLMLGVLAILYREDWRIGVAFTTFAVLALAGLQRVLGLAVPHWRAERQASAELFGFLEERLAGMEDIRSSGASAHVMRRLYEAMRRHAQKTQRAWLMGTALWSTSMLLFAAGNALALGLGALLLAQGTITLGTVYLLFHYTELLRRPLEEITRQIQEFQRAGAGIARITELARITTNVQDGPGADLPPGPLAVEFDDVHFSYVAAEPVLRGVTFRLEPGRVLGLLGRTGSGKTTITRLLCRLYDPLHGTIRLGGRDLRLARLEELRCCIGMVTQEVQLFHASVRDNLTLFDRQMPEARILAVIEEIGLGDWLRALPQGLDTELAASSGLSAGEAQLLAFARVFLQDPGLVILDEASSRLDPATEQQIERALDRLLRGRTAIIVAHRLATVHRADQIAILENGRILEYGDRVTLAQEPSSYFSRLLQVGLEEVLV